MNDVCCKEGRIWRIQGTLPVNEAKGRRWKSNAKWQVLAETVEEAIAIVREQEPESMIYGANCGEANSYILFRKNFVDG